MSEGGAAKVSILVPVYNTRRFLPGCLESLLCQTLEQIEVIAVDDGSTDGSDRILASFAARDERLRVLRQPNRGLGATRNAGLDAARGEYVAFIDSDDWVEPEFCQAMADEADRAGADVTICDFRVVRDGPAPTVTVVRHPEDVRNKEELLLALLGLRVPGFSWNKLYRRSMVEAARLRFPTRDQFENVEDQYYSLRAIHLAERLAFVTRPLVNYRIHPGSIVQKYQPTALRDVVELFRQNAAFVGTRNAVAGEEDALRAAFLTGVFGCLLNECKSSNPRPYLERARAFRDIGRHPDFRAVFDQAAARRTQPWKRRLVLGAVRFGWARVAYALCQAYWRGAVENRS